MKSAFAFLIAMFTGTLLGATQEAEQVLFEDKFSSLADGWSWVREDPKGWRLSKGKLEIRSQPGGLWRDKNIGKNILLRTPPDAKDGVLMIEVTIHSQPKELFENAGIVWYYDDDNYVILNKEFYDRKPFPGIQMVREVKQKSSVPKHAPYEADQVCLRLVVSGLPRLETIELRETRITNEGLKHLKGQPMLWLDLSITSVTDEGLEHLKGFKKIQQLRLNRLKVTDAGLKHLAGLSSLRLLEVADTQITDAGLKHVRKLNNLTWLMLTGTQVSDVGLEELYGLTGLRTLYV